MLIYIRNYKNIITFEMWIKFYYKMGETMENKEKNSENNKKKLIITFMTIGILLFIIGWFELPTKITQFIGSKFQNQMKITDNYLEITRDNEPNFSVRFNDDNTKAYVTLTEFPEEAIIKEYRIDSDSEDWIACENGDTFEIELKRNTILQTRYKLNENADYVTSSSKVIVDLEYDIELPIPQIKLTEQIVNGTEYNNTTISEKDVIAKLKTPDSEDKTIVYEVSVTRYSLSELTDVGYIVGSTVKSEEIKNYKSNQDAEYVKFETTTDETYGNTLFERIEGTTDELKLTKSGVYKIKVRATTHGGFIKSEEQTQIVTINKVSDNSLFKFKTTDGMEYDFTSNNATFDGEWVNKDVVVYLNRGLESLEEDILFGNIVITYQLSNETTGNTKPETVLNLDDLTTIDGIANAIGKITDVGTTKFYAKIKIGAMQINETYNVNIDRTSPTCTITANPSDSLTNSESITYTFTWSEVVTGFTKDDITLTQGTAPGSLSGSGTTYTLVVNNSGTCTQKVEVAANKCTDIAGNSNVTSTSKSVTIDRTVPVWAYASKTNTNSSAAAYASNSHTITITFKGTDTNYLSNSLTKDNITVKVGGTTVTPTTKTLSSEASINNGVQYTLTLAGITGNGTLTITLSENTLKDKAGNNNALTTFTPGITIDNKAPAISKLEATPTTNSITATVTATDNATTDSGIKGYRFSKDNGTTWTTQQTSAQYKFEKLTQNTTYNVLVEVEDKTGNKQTASATPKTGTVTALTQSNVTFTYSPSGWYNDDVSVTIKTTVTGFTLQYSLDGTNWNNYTGAIVVSQNQAIYARLWDGKNAGGHATGNVINIDRNVPNAPTITVSTGTKKTGYNYYDGAVTIKVTAGTDTGGSNVKNVTYSVTGAKASSGSYTSSGTFNLSTHGAYTITAYTHDNAGNTSTASKLTLNVCITHSYTTTASASACKTCSLCGNVVAHTDGYWNTWYNTTEHKCETKCKVCSYVSATNYHTVTSKSTTASNVTTTKYYCNTCDSTKEIFSGIAGWWKEI